MKNEMVQNLNAGQYRTFTENGAAAYSSAAAGSLLDLFSLAGSLRSRIHDISSMFASALCEERLLAVKLAFYTRDVRGGLGERDAGRMMFHTLANLFPEVMKKNLALIPEYGRYDDLVSLLDTRVKEDVLAILKEQLEKDIKAMKKGQPVSLLAKWLPSVNTSSLKTRKKARMIASSFGLSEKEYRKMLSALRSYMNVTEVRLSAKDYELIRYEAVPSYAMMRYRNAFAKHDTERFVKYMNDVSEGRKVIHSDTLYPYDLVSKYCSDLRADLFDCGWSGIKDEDEIIEAQWQALPEYLSLEENTLVMVDISGSMYGRPMATSTGLGIYFAERMKGAFHNRIMLFAEHPVFIELKGSTLRDKLIQILGQDIGYSTDLEAAFSLVLDTAVRNHMKNEDLPQRIVVISDGEINALRESTDWLFMDEMKRRFERAGYRMPDLVLWNVESRQNTFHALSDTENVQMCSGQSISVFKTLTDCLHMTPYEYMIHVLNSPRYECITV